VALDKSGNLQREWIKSSPAAGDEYAVPAGHVIKGESALLDPDGRVMAKWVKTREGTGEGLVQALHEVFANHTGSAPLIPAPIESDDTILTVYPLPDLHFGMYAWGQESGSDYDTTIAARMAEQTVASLVAQSRPSSKAVILGLGDYFHANDLKGVTPANAHRLDVDTRWPRVFAAGAKLAVAIVELAARKHREVEVVFLPGNHDPDAAMSLTVALALFYSNNPRITVHQDPGIAWFRRHGRTLLAATHGHTMPPARAAMMVATDRADDWGKSDHRHLFMGHIHHEKAHEIGGIRVETFQAPAPKDAYAAHGGFRAGRSLSAITFHETQGEIGRHRVNLAGKAA
jgi:UDP-2,3-diacylglucosamine pyrophosphatase LpxH